MMMNKKSGLVALLVVAACCLVSGVNAQESSTAGSGGVAPTELPPLVTPDPTPAPKTKTPAKTPTPEPSTEAPVVVTPEPTTSTPTPTTRAPEPEAGSTEAPVTATPEPTVTTKAPKATKNETTAAPEETANETVLPEPSFENAVTDNTASDSNKSGTSPSNGASYGTKGGSGSSSGAASKEATTSTASASNNGAMQLVVGVVGALALVLAASMSVFFYQRRRARQAEEDEEDDKYVTERPKRHVPSTASGASSAYPTARDLDIPPSTTTAAVPTAYDNYRTPQATAYGGMSSNYSDEKFHVKNTTQWTQPAAAYRDSEELFDAPLSKPMNKSERSASSGSAVRGTARGNGENDITGDDEHDVAMAPQQQFMQSRITKFRGKSEDSNMGDDKDFAPMYGQSQMHAFNVTDSEVDLDSLQYAPTKPTSSNNTNRIMEFDFDAVEPVAAPAAAIPAEFNDVDVDIDRDVDVDIDGEDEDVDIDDDARDSEYTVGDARGSVASSVGEFHDSTVDRFSELDAEEFEV